ncbi:hypothetical protein H8959_010310 [Pygathrix nigripes]
MPWPNFVPSKQTRTPLPEAGVRGRRSRPPRLPPKRRNPNTLDSARLPVGAGSGHVARRSPDRKRKRGAVPWEGLRVGHRRASPSVPASRRFWPAGGARLGERLAGARVRVLGATWAAGTASRGPCVPPGSRVSVHEASGGVQADEKNIIQAQIRVEACRKVHLSLWICV